MLLQGETKDREGDRTGGEEGKRGCDISQRALAKEALKEQILVSIHLGMRWNSAFYRNWLSAS